MKTLKFQCEDHYEAEKLASLMSMQKDDTAWLSGVEAAVDNEIVIQLKDRSSHAVLLKDEQTVVMLKTFVKEIVEGKMKIQSSECLGSITEVTILD
ncbi:MAG: hypothetical protein M3298_07710 [Thermoproteota archaeon]|jgi:hypothetical protein|nr:hypothetical protein [Thermoproteota archaeon]MDQ3808036.1 hypothetical protein [Thermoproteota archaeon]MDQ3882964.1 hypothetical protein [Thermoproteota archaeon]MDQ5843287.1 hypothetical protein [Thermoproteota archaeon]